MTSDTVYSVLDNAQQIFDNLIKDNALPIPSDARELAKNVKFLLPRPSADAADSDVVLPCPLKQCETVSALKAVEASIANAIGKLRFGFEQSVEIDLQHATLFLFMAYLATVDGLGKLNPEVKKKLVDTDLLQAQSNLYRRMSANLYKTKDEKYYHIHGSLEAGVTLNMIGLPAHDETQTDYQQIIKTIGDAVAKFTAEELETMNAERRQAGTTCYTREQFLETPHGKVISAEPYWTTDTLETQSPPVPFAEVPANQPKQILAGFKVVEMCRIIAGPTITRILAEYGAQVIKITSANLSDVPFFQVDGNMGKHTANLDLKTEAGRVQFEELIADADMIVDGYRTDALAKLGFGPEQFAERGIRRGKGYIYVSENCYGFDGEWAYRPGWQQIADCVSGVAYIQGEALGRPGEPIIPPFPMSDYGTGCMGAIGALDAVYKRATKGGSYWAKTSLVQYDLLLMAQGLYPDEVWKKVIGLHDEDVRKIRYYDSVDQISGAALRSMWRLRPDIFTEVGQKKYMDEEEAPGFHGTVRTLKPVVKMDKTLNKFNEVTRPNGYDKPVWW